MQILINAMPYLALLTLVIANNKGQEIMEETAEVYKSVKAKIDDINPS